MADNEEALLHELCMIVDELRGNTPSQANTRVTRRARDHTHQSPENQLAKIEKLRVIADRLKTVYTSSAHKSMPITVPAEVEGSTQPTPNDEEYHTPNDEGCQNTAVACGSPVQESASSPFHLPRERMGVNFPQSIEQFYKEATFDGRFTFDHDVAAIKAEIHKLEISSDYDQLAVHYVAAKPFPILQLAKSNKFHKPNLDIPPSLSALSQNEAEAVLNTLHSSLPQGNIPYYTGPCATAKFGEILNAGKYFNSLREIPGLNTTYVHMGEEYSGTPWHVEDLENHESRSVNVVYIGYKLFVLIAPEDKERFESYVKRSGKTGQCAQFVRHHSIFVSPKQLRSERISFTTHCLGPGDGIVTLPGQYHMVVNLTMNVALSINFTLPNPADSRALLDGIEVCKKCGISEDEGPSTEHVPATPSLLHKETPFPAATLRLPNKAVAQKRKTIAQEPDCQTSAVVANSRKVSIANSRKRQRTTAVPTLATNKKAMGRILNATVRTLIDFIHGETAIQRFRSLIEQLRRLDRRKPLTMGELQDLENKTDFIRLQQRLIEVNFVKEEEEIKEKTQMKRLVADPLKSLANKYGIDTESVRYYRKKGKRWVDLVGKYDGLLCYISIKETGSHPVAPGVAAVTRGDVDVLTGRDIEQFHEALDTPYTKALCRAGKAFQESLCSGHDIVFRFESSGQPHEPCNEEEVLEQLQPLPFTDQNIWDPELFPDKPTNWPDGQEWPVDPTALAQDDSKRCDSCPGGADCACENTFGRAYQLKYYGSELGLQAVAQEPGAVAYKKDSILGVRAGEIVPADKFHDRWTVKFRRPDFDGEPVVCAVRTADRGNCLGFIRRSEKCNACFRSVRRNGRWVIAVEACRDIMDGEQITVEEGCD